MCRPSAVIFTTSVVVYFVIGAFWGPTLAHANQKHNGSRDVRNRDDKHHASTGTNARMQNSKDFVDSNDGNGLEIQLQKEVDVLKDSVSALNEKMKELSKTVLDLQSYVSSLQKDGCPHGVCPTGAVKYGCTCLLYVMERSRKWKEARNYCNKMGAKLVSIDSSVKQKHIRDFLKHNLAKNGIRNTKIYTGLIRTTHGSLDPSYDSLHQGSKRSDGWYWVSLDSTVRLGQYTNWLREPKANSNETIFEKACMHLDGAQSLKWMDSYCDEEKQFVCEFRLSSAKYGRHKGKQRTFPKTAGREEDVGDKSRKETT